MNLLSETLRDIKTSGHSVEDIAFIGSEKSGHSCTWQEFKRMADREYDSGFGAPEVAQDLVVVFIDGAKMWRGEYDGSEWWAFSEPFERPQETLPIKHIFVDDCGQVGWCNLAELNDPDHGEE